MYYCIHLFELKNNEFININRCVLVCYLNYFARAPAICGAGTDKSDKI